MPEFEAKDDPLRLSEAGREPQSQPRARPITRGRSLTSRRCGRVSAPVRQVRLELESRRMLAVRRACGGVLPTASHRRRRLWTTCHGWPPGTAS